MKKIFKNQEEILSNPRVFLLILLSFLSGMCGIAYEVLYARVLSTYLGDIFYVAGAILSIFLLGIALGSLWANRFFRHLWLIETGIGVYAILFSLFFGLSQDYILHTLTPAVSHGIGTVVVIVLAFLLVPSLMIGTTVPLFSRYIDHYRKEHHYEGFNLIYLFYNLGAALCVLAVEFVFLRQWGNRSVLCLIGAINIVTGLTLFAGGLTPPAAKEHAHESRPSGLRGLVPDWHIAVLTGMSFLSGIFQLLLLKYTSFLFGPFHENFAMVVAVVLAVIALGVFLVEKFGISFESLIRNGSLVIGLNFLLLGPLFLLRGHLEMPAQTLGGVLLGQPALLVILAGTIALIFAGGLMLLMAAALVPGQAVKMARRGVFAPLAAVLVLAAACTMKLALVRLGADSNMAYSFRDWAIKLFLIALIGGPTLMIFGGTIPALYRSCSPDRRTAGLLLAISSLGNAAGYLCMIMFLDSLFSYRELSVLILAAVMTLGLAPGIRNGKSPQVFAAALVLGVAVWVFWPSQILSSSYLALANPELLQKVLTKTAPKEVFKGYGYNITILEQKGRSADRKDGTGQYLLIDGYQSLEVQPNDIGNLHETIVGVTPALFSRQHKKALVLGIGTGITAAGTAYMYDKVTAVDVNPLIISGVVPWFKRQNGDLAHRPGVDMLLQDGLTAVATGREKYDAIISTVTSPLFFSSSKIYTGDFFRLATQSLAPGGVYAFWFDIRVGERGTRIILQTIRQNFADCRLVYLTDYYTEVICSNQPMSMHAPDTLRWPQELQSRLKEEVPSLPAAQFFPSLVLPADGIFSGRWDVPANSFNYLALEYAMSAALSRTDPYTSWNIYDYMSRKESLTESQASQRCLALRIMENRRCADEMRGKYGHYPRAYITGAEKQAMLSFAWAGDVMQMANDLAANNEFLEARKLLDDFGEKYQDDFLNDKNQALLARYLLLEASLYPQEKQPVPADLLNRIYSIYPLSTELRDFAAAQAPPVAARAHLALTDRILAFFPELRTKKDMPKPSTRAALYTFR